MLVSMCRKGIFCTLLIGKQHRMKVTDNTWRFLKNMIEPPCDPTILLRSLYRCSSNHHRVCPHESIVNGICFQTTKFNDLVLVFTVVLMVPVAIMWLTKICGSCHFSAFQGMLIQYKYMTSKFKLQFLLNGYQFCIILKP